MGKTACIIDTNQLIDCPEVLDYVVKKEYIVYIPDAVLQELDKKLVDNVFDDKFIEKIRKAKKILNKNKDKYINIKLLVKSSTFADPKILQCVLELMSDRSIKNIIVYTKDGDLTADVFTISKLKSIEHMSSVKALSFDSVKQNVHEKAKQPHDQKKKFKYLNFAPDGIFVWRNSGFLENSEKNYHATATESAPVPTLSGKKEVLKFWLWRALANDWIKIYKDTAIKKGDKISLNFMTLDNSCDLFIGLELYVNGTNKKQHSDFISITPNKWHTLSITADDEYNDINFAVKVRKNSKWDGNFDGTAGYIDDFKITYANN